LTGEAYFEVKHREDFPFKVKSRPTGYPRFGYNLHLSGTTFWFLGKIAGIIIIGWMGFSPLLFTGEELQKYASPFHNYLSIVFGTVTIFIVGFLIGNLIFKQAGMKVKDKIR
jgi:hypothetical protein